MHGLKGDLDAQSSNGGLELLDIEGQVVGRTSNGRIRAERVRGGLQLNSSNGGVTAELARADRPGPYRDLEQQRGPVAARRL